MLGTDALLAEVRSRVDSRHSAGPPIAYTVAGIPGIPAVERAASVAWITASQSEMTASSVVLARKPEIIYG
jgi:hypothetical protein